MAENIAKPITNPTPAAVPIAAPAAPAEAASVATLTDVPNEIQGNQVDTLIPSDPYYMDPLFYEVANYFGLEQEDYVAAKNKLSDIVDHIIRQEKSNAPEVVLKAIRALEDKIQRPSWDERRYTNVHKYVRLAAKGETIKQAMGAFEKSAKGEIT